MSKLHLLMNLVLTFSLKYLYDFESHNLKEENK